MKFTDNEVNVLKKMIAEHVHGLDPGTGEMFTPRQKPFTYEEMTELRRVLGERRSAKGAEAGRRAAEEGMRMAQRHADALKQPWSAYTIPKKLSAMTLSTILEHAADALILKHPQGPVATMTEESWEGVFREEIAPGAMKKSFRESQFRWHLTLIDELRDRARRYRGVGL